MALVQQFEITAGSDSDQMNGGPFAIGSGLYVVSWGIPGAAHVFRSTNGGSTWTELDSTHAPVNFHSPANAVWDGNITLWVMTTSSEGVIFFTPFDIVAQAWGASTSTLNFNSYVGISPLGFRADGTILVFSEFDAIPNAQCQFFIFNSSTLASTLWVPCGFISATLSCEVYGMFEGLGGEWWFTFIAVLSVGVNSLVIQSISALNVLGTLVTIDSSVSSVSNAVGSGPFSDGITVVLPWQEDESSLNISVWTAPLVSMVFTLQTVSVPPGGDIEQFAVTRSPVAGSLLFVIYSTSLLLYTDAGGGFNSGVLLIELIGYQSIIANMITPSSGSGWALVVDSIPPLFFLIPAIPTGGKAMYGGVGSVILPASIGSLCKYARRVRCVRAPRRTILSTGPLVFGGGR